MNKTNITSTNLLIILVCLSSNLWADETNKHNYIELKATQWEVDGEDNDTLFGGGIESQYAVTNNIHIRGGYNQHRNTDVTFSDYYVGLGLSSSPIYDLTITGYSNFKKTNLDAKSYQDKAILDIDEITLGVSLKYQLFDQLSFLSQFEVIDTNTEFKFNETNDESFQFKDSFHLYKTIFGLQGRFKNLSYKLTKDKYHSSNENELFLKDNRIIAKVAYHFTENFSLGISREFNTEIDVSQLMVRYSL